MMVSLWLMLICPAQFCCCKNFRLCKCINQPKAASTATRAEATGGDQVFSICPVTKVLTDCDSTSFFAMAYVGNHNSQLKHQIMIWYHCKQSLGVVWGSFKVQPSIVQMSFRTPQGSSRAEVELKLKPFEELNWRRSLPIFLWKFGDHPWQCRSGMNTCQLTV